MPRSRRYQSARKANSSGATGHLIGMSTRFTTSRPPSKALERAAQRVGALGAVEGEDALVPAGPGQALGLLGLQAGAARDDEHVVGQHRAVVEQHLVALDPDLLDLVLVEDDAVAQLPPAGPHDLIDLREPERDEEQAGLVDVAVVAVDDVDLGLVRVEAAAQPVGGHRAARAAAEDHDLLRETTHAVPARCLHHRDVRVRRSSAGGARRSGRPAGASPVSSGR